MSIRNYIYFASDNTIYSYDETTLNIMNGVYSGDDEVLNFRQSVLLPRDFRMNIKVENEYIVF
ncbi:MAG TPA: hypothetical protein PKL57_18310, partial [Candidatus Wallbacteria bacterium]|nr:hypothetical protein [Candidatus Wallbacteria bacterium]